MQNRKIKILWADDEIDLLKPSIIFLETKGYEVLVATNGQDAIDFVKSEKPDLVILDQNMPGISGTEALQVIKAFSPELPVVMITKSEEEFTMEEAIGYKISDYLIKPVNPKQILLSIKKNIEKRTLITQKITSSYQSEFGKLSLSINSAKTFAEWEDVYKRLVFWEMEMEDSTDPGMIEIISNQKEEANNGFVRFVKQNYESWVGNKGDDHPLLSHNVLVSKIFPGLRNKQQRVVLIVIDNLRFDQWKAIAPDISNFYQVESEELYCSVLPTATQFARNALFSGLMPGDIEKHYPKLWLNEDEEGSKNPYEEELLKTLILRTSLNIDLFYDKILSQRDGKRLLENVGNLTSFPLSVLVYNFVDMLSHSRTDNEVIKELVNDDPAYRSITRSWFRHSYLFDLLKELSRQKVKVIITSDHGSVKVDSPVKVVGDRNTSTNLRYKQGKSLNYNPREVYEIKDPSKISLPKANVSSAYIFATGTDFFAYPNNYNYFVNFYRNTYQHGGISMEEMLVPFISLYPKL